MDDQGCGRFKFRGQHAHTVRHSFDSDCIPRGDMQAHSRALYRPNQGCTHPQVNKGKSAEEATYQRARRQLDIDDEAIQARRFNNKSAQGR